MRFLLQLPVVRSLHKRQLLFPVVVVLVIVGVLAQGALEQSPPAEAVQETSVTEPVPVAVPRALIRPDLEKTPLTYFADYWSQLAEQASPSLALVGPSRTPAVLVGPRLALTTVDAALEVLAARNREAAMREPEDGEADEDEDGDAVTDTDAEVNDAEPAVAAVDDGPFRLRGWSAEVGLALFDVAGEDRAAFTLADPRALPSGSYLAAVTVSRDGEPTVSPGYLVTTKSGEYDDDATGDLVISMDLPSTLVAAAVVNLDGALVGFAYAGPDGHRVVTSAEMLELIEQLQTDAVCRSVEVADLTDDVRTILALETGVLIEYVRQDAFDPAPSLRGGDVLLEWAGERLQTAEQFNQLYDVQEPGALVRYRTLRNRRRVSGGTVMPNAECEPLRPGPVRLAPFGLAVQWAPETADETDEGSGWRVVAVAPDGPSAQAGIEELDWVVAINGEILAEEADGQLLESASERPQPLLLSLRRDDRMRLVAVSPADE